jgi:excisionase family DNA binding protein
MARTVKEKADWLTKQEAARIIGISERSVERLVQSGKIRQRYLRVAQRRPIAILSPDDVETIRQETIAKIPPPLVETEGDSKALATRPTKGTDINALMAALTATQARQEPKLFLTLREAATYSGLTVAYLRRLVDNGKLDAIKDRGTKVRRTDLQKL